MKPRRPLPSRDRLLSLFNYDMDTGLLYWRVRPWIRSRVRPGDEAGTLHHSGYVQVAVEGVLFMGHRIVWKMQTGQDPLDEIDHRNGIRNDNRWTNLRAADRPAQGANKTTPNWHRGVHYIGKSGKYGAQIKWQRRHFWLGVFDTPEEACTTYKAKARELHGEYVKQGRCACR